MRRCVNTEGRGAVAFVSVSLRFLFILILLSAAHVFLVEGKLTDIKMSYNTGDIDTFVCVRVWLCV